MTTDRATLLALADRVEAASGPDRALDAEIWLAAVPGATRRKWSYVHKATGRECEVDETRQADGRLIVVPRHTASLDAALSLPRKGFIAALSELAADGLPGCCICTDTTTSPPTEVWGICFTSGPAVERLARATTAAALRALAQEAPSDG